MADILGGDIKKGDVIIYQNKLCKVSSTMHVKPGKGGAFNQVGMSDIVHGTKFDVRFRTEEKIEKADMRIKQLTFAYQDGDMYYFMDGEGNEYPVKSDDLGVRNEFLEVGALMLGEFHDENLINLNWDKHASVTYKIAETHTHMKGSTVTAKDKPAVLENGAEVTVPLYVNIGDTIKIHPADGSFIGIAN